MTFLGKCWFVRREFGPRHRFESNLPMRKLKIEADGDGWKGAIKPKIRLMGRWLERAGFKPGKHVHVTCVALSHRITVAGYLDIERNETDLCQIGLNAFDSVLF